MKKRLWAALLAATLALGLLTGCGGDKGVEAGTPVPAPAQSAKPSTKLDKPPQPEQIISDVNSFSRTVLPAGATAATCEVIKRQSNPEQKEDIVYCCLEGPSNAFTLSRYYVKLLYNYYDEGGWILDEMESDQIEKWEDIGFLDGAGKPIEDGLTALTSVENATTEYYEGDSISIGIDDIGRWNTKDVLYDVDGAVLCENYTDRDAGTIYEAEDESGLWYLYDAGTPISKGYEDVYPAGAVTDENGTIIDHRWGAVQAGRVGFLDDRGQEVIPFLYAQSYLNSELETVDYSFRFQSNLCEVADGTTRWIIDASGRQLYSFDTQEQYLSIACSRGFVITTNYDGQIVCDLNGQSLLPERYYNIIITPVGICAPKDDYWLVYDWQGHRTNRIGAEYYSLAMLNKDRFYATDHDLFQLVDGQGEYIATARGSGDVGYDALIVWNGDDDNHLSGVVDLDGNTIIPTEYEYVNAIDYGLYLVTNADDGSEALFDWQGRQRTPFFEQIRSISPQENYFVIQKEGVLYRLKNPLSAEELAQCPRIESNYFLW